MALKLVKEEPGELKYKSLEGLNEAQLEAVTTISGPVLIIAGAGSGKTRVLTHRIAFLIEQGIKPYEILALTFTNKAAGEMRERIASLVPREAANSIWAGTFHSIFARILRIESSKIGFTSSFSIYDTDDSLSLVRRIVNSKGINDKQLSPQNIRNKISWAKNRMIDYQTLHSESKYSSDKIIADIYKEYEEELIRSNSMDFDDLLLNLIKLFVKFPDILEKYISKFKYILVDEYQDTNRPQYLVCKMLAGSTKNICVVGDDAQSIYKWRGAEIRNILEFQKDFPAARIVRLERNYRSTKTILEAADSVIKFNKGQIPKTLWTENPEGELIRLVECGDDIDEAEFVIKQIKDLISRKDFDAKDFAVLYRTNAQSLAFENACRKNNVPYIIIGGMSFYKRKEVKDTLAYLKFITNLKDSESLLRIINEPPRGIGHTTLNHFRAYSKEKDISIFEAFRKADKIEELQTRAKNAANSFVRMVDNMLELKEKALPQDFAKKYIEQTGLLQMYSELATEEAYDRWNNIQQVLNDIYRYFSEEPESDLTDYLQQISLISEIDEKDLTLPRVKLLTLHSAKGLEFPNVFIAGVEKGLFPFSRAESNPEEEEEERRLFYVGITRAMENLFITYACRRMRFGEYNVQSPSKFIAEIPAELIEHNTSRLKPAVPSKKPSYNSSKDTYNYSQIPEYENYSQIPETGSFKVGDRVRHAHFGLGQIVSMAGEGTKRQATVNFTTVGRKKLMLQYAKLQKL